jgi:hypothetical protein
MANRRNNPRNPQSELFRKLTRLLSGPISTFRRQSPRRLTRTQLDDYHSRFKSASGQQFKRSDETQKSLGNLTANFMSNQNRFDRYIDFDQMEYTPEIASALDIYADEITTSSEMNEILSIRTHDEEIKLELKNLFFNILNIEFNLFGWTRSMCKFGDYFLYLDLDEVHGIKHVIGLPAQEIERMEGEDPDNPNYVQYQWNSGGLTLENWQVAHFRILGNDRHAPYGTSVLEPARRIWRQLTLLEDAVMAYRIVRSPERRVFYIDVGNIAPQDIEQYMHRVMTQMKRNQVVDPETGRVDLRYNPLSLEEDYFIPVRGGTSSRVETLTGGAYTGDIDDIKYLRDKLFSALKIPASYLSRGEGGEEDKTTLAQKDIRFARTVQRLQRSTISELEKIAVIHLFTKGYRGKDLSSFRIRLNNPSKLAQLQELEHWSKKFEVATGATEGYFSKRWIAENMFGLAEEEFVRMKQEMFYDKKFDALLERVAEEVTTGADAGGAAGGLGGEFGEEPGGELGGEELGGEELGGEELGAEPAGEEEAGDEGMLLASPPEGGAKRDDGRRVRRTATGEVQTTTPGANSKWYIPKKYEGAPQRGGSRHMSGRRAMHYKGLSGMESATATDRAFLKGHSKLLGLGYGISENVDTNYNDEEENIFALSYEINNLIKLMESKKDESETQT